RLKFLLLSACFLLAVMLSLLNIFITQAQAQGAGVGVLNVPPEYRNLQIVSNGSVVEVRLIVTDYNSWRDIQQVRVDIRIGTKGDIIAAFLYKQYSDEENKVRIDEFRNIIGSALVPERCKVERSNSTSTISDRCSMRLTFAFLPVPGDSIEISITDSAREEIASGYIQYGATGGVPTPPGMFLIPGWNIPIFTTPESAECFLLAICATITVMLVIQRWLYR
ncbi:MAG: hypothetical protein AB1485_04905, partial [Candidatus Thermoplasmatota archaeon]